MQGVLLDAGDFQFGAGDSIPVEPEVPIEPEVPSQPEVPVEPEVPNQPTSRRPNSPGSKTSTMARAC